MPYFMLLKDKIHRPETSIAPKCKAAVLDESYKILNFALSEIKNQ